MFYRGLRGFGSCFGLGSSFYGGWFMPLMMGVLMAAAVVAIIMIMKKSRHSTGKNKYDASLEELKIEYAKGNLTEEEYMRKKKILSD